MPWFRRVGWFHVPVSAAGVVVTLGALAFCVQVSIAVDRQSHSVSDTLYGVYPFILPTLLLLDWVASRTSGTARGQP
jgi:chorismate mutase